MIKWCQRCGIRKDPVKPWLCCAQSRGFSQGSLSEGVGYLLGRVSRGERLVEAR